MIVTNNHSNALATHDRLENIFMTPNHLLPVPTLLIPIHPHWCSDRNLIYVSANMGILHNIFFKIKIPNSEFK